ncbi:cysteine desulfurase family protein [Clostridium tepidum]|uniref:cysteine desulfurase n=1 Tax=Clostridium tepidum TaxID=1962263 RepID=A0A1S9IBG1_9CLOT|nr:cysteine desulfurase family protein [Clostridium tepidum]MCR1933419.1 cysteine desulfurase [Clostridium tepidum]MDU6878184.1 cysteine desulfurase family protein [Clostridium botulinum]OOO61689.1 cysteine desulfurase NifS [Clostridium tepidum]OOO67651.1 cysteine desulfurase NifS [Clostridium tepidum]
MKNNIYMDHAATTYIKKDVLDAMIPYLTQYYANPSAIYNMSNTLKIAIDEAKEEIADFIGGEPEEIFFTSGGTEGDNWAIKGVAYGNESKGRHIITSSIEHPAVLNSCKYLEQKGFEITFLPVDKIGRIDLKKLEESIRKDTILVSIMTANNEIGTIQDIKSIGEICRSHKVLFHTDAVQALGQTHINVREMNIDLMTMAAHKIYGPKGIGALYIKKGTKIDNLLHGGSQERGKRAGTENLAAIVGFQKAISLLKENGEEENKRIEKLRDKFIKGLLQIEGTKINGALGDDRLKGNINVSFKNIDGDLLLMLLDNEGICASAGSACSAGAAYASHVLLALGLDKKLSKKTIRFTLGAKNTEEEIEFVLKKLKKILN